VISGRSKSTLAAPRSSSKAAGSGEAIAVDVADQKEVADAAAAIPAPARAHRHPRQQAPASTRRSAISATVSVESWNQIVAINLSGMFYCCHAVLPAMRKRKDGLVINVASWAGRYASTLTGPGYNATKRAVIALNGSRSTWRSA